MSKQTVILLCWLSCMLDICWTSAWISVGYLLDNCYPVMLVFETSLKAMNILITTWATTVNLYTGISEVWSMLNLRIVKDEIL